MCPSTVEYSLTVQFGEGSERIRFVWDRREDTAQPNIEECGFDVGWVSAGISNARVGGIVC